MKCYNLSRAEIANVTNDHFSTDDHAWISINEPGNEPTKNERLDALNTLKMNFWDIVRPTPIIGSSEPALPPTEDDAKRIVDFILKNKEKNIITNCAAGKSRSGAICRFLNEMLQYEWMEPWKNRAIPNKLLFENMVKYYFQLGHSKPTIIIDKRRMNYFDVK